MTLNSSRQPPLVSIITPVLNGDKYLEPCIQSVLNQTYPNIEHIIVDGGSKDNTVKILKKYSGEFPQRVVFVSEPDKGTGDAWNKGIKLSKGQILGELGSDDMLEPNGIAPVINFFSAHPTATVVYGGLAYIDETGKTIEKVKGRDFDFYEVLNNGCYVPTSALFYKKEIFDKIGYIDDLGNDLNFILRLGKEYRLYRIDDHILNFRKHKDSASTGYNIKIRKMWLKEDWLDSRFHGGKFFSYYGKRYFRYVVRCWLEMILGPAFPVLKKLKRNISKILEHL